MSLTGCLNSRTFYLRIFCCMYIQVAAALWQDYEMVGIDNIKNGSLITTDLRQTRINKTTFAISGTVNFLSDFNNDWEAEAAISYSSTGNNQFVKTVYGKPKADLCNQVDGAYVALGYANRIASMSDLPSPKKSESLCAAYKKGLYTVRQYQLRREAIPKFLEPGYYKFQFLIYNKKNPQDVQDIAVYFRLIGFL